MLPSGSSEKPFHSTDWSPQRARRVAGLQGQPKTNVSYRLSPALGVLLPRCVGGVTQVRKFVSNVVPLIPPLSRAVRAEGRELCRSRPSGLQQKVLRPTCAFS